MSYLSPQDLGDKCKDFENLSPAATRLLPGLPVCARLDGKAFHTFTKSLPRPFCKELHDLMVDTTRFLVEETNATIGYTQSDEISLVWDARPLESSMIFDGKVYKLLSILSSMCSVHFNTKLQEYLPSKNGPAFFDCRVFNVPNRMWALNTLLFRESDATKNSVSMAARAHFSPKECFSKSSAEMKTMLEAKGVIWADYPAGFKRGTYVRRVKREIAFTVDEIAKLPAKHAARTNPALRVERSVVEILNPPPITRLANLEGFVFNGEVPVSISKK